MRKFLLFSITCLFFFTCKKKQPADPGSFFTCHAAQQLDSSAIYNKLLGTWSFSSRFCESSSSINPAYFYVKINFDANGSFTVTAHSGTLTQGNWKLKMVDTNSWGLDLTSPSEFLYGRILFCKNELMFNNSYVDGCDNIFYK